MKKKKIAIVFGTRPEAIKMAPVIRKIKQYSHLFTPLIIVTAQHREMLDQVLDLFDIIPDYDLDIMKGNQTLSDVTANILLKIEEIYKQEKPDMVLVHGDTTTSFVSALSAFYQKIPIGHVEAGLRTHDKYSPFPEEMNRVMIDNMSDIMFVPTEQTKSNLVKENHNPNKIKITGNTAIDVIQYTKLRNTQSDILNLIKSNKDKKWILITMHRRENHGIPMQSVFNAVKRIATYYSNVEFIIPVHMSPIVKKSVNKYFKNNSKVHIVESLEVDVFHNIMSQVHMVLTDSGGIQEEAPAHNVPVLVLRDKTERPEGVESGTLKLIGTKEEDVYQNIKILLENSTEYLKMSKSINPYGDGNASERIVNHLISYFDLD